MFGHFSLDTYRKLVELLLKERANVCFEDFPLKDNSKAYLILRHDVDLSPEAALRMAELEKNIGVRACYFVLFSSPYYNLLSENYCWFARRLRELGHEVGLHYDLRAYAARGERDSWLTLLEEASLLSTLVGKPIRSISMHNPSVSGQDLFLSRDDFINAYHDRFVKEIGYFSDSGGAWRDETVHLFETGMLPCQIQLLTHPIFWVEEAGNRWETLDRFIESKIGALKNESRLVKELWSKHPAVIQHDKRNGKLFTAPSLTASASATSGDSR